MTMYWIYHIPTWLLGLGTVCTFVVLSVSGLVLTRRMVARLVGPPPGANDVVSYYFAGFGVFYGLTTGLIAVATWQQYSDTDRSVGAEAATIGALYRDMSSYPEPFRTKLQNGLRDYTRTIIDDEWPVQREGGIPTGGRRKLKDVQDVLFEFEPATSGKSATHSEALAAFNRVVELRRARIQAVKSGLPAALWWVLLVGSALTASSGYLFHTANFRVHLVLTIFMAALMGLLVFLIAAMDNPFRGEVSIGPDAYQLIYDGLMSE